MSIYCEQDELPDRVLPSEASLSLRTSCLGRILSLRRLRDENGKCCGGTCGLSQRWIRRHMSLRSRNWLIRAVVCSCIVILGCTAPAKYREVTLGMRSEEVLALLGEPDTKERKSKQSPTVDYFGPKPSAAYLSLPEGALVEIWSYRHFRETWTYVFSLEEHTPILVDTGYYHPAIKY